MRDKYYNGGSFEVVKPSVSDIGVSNRNLLHNWDFRRPINSRGKTSYNTPGTYCLDRWEFIWDSATNGIVVNSGYITFKATTTHSCSIGQVVQNGVSLAGKTITFSGIIRRVAATDAIFLIAEYDASSNYSGTSVHLDGGSGGDWALVQKTMVVKPTTTTLLFLIYAQTNVDMDIQCVKLELGSVSTLANDPPADYTEQILICQSISDDGAKYQRGAGSNKNLFHNWDFRSPVNQRAFTTTSAPSVYTVDRWFKQSNQGTMTLNSGYITLNGVGADCTIIQVLETDLTGRTVTLSVLLADGTLSSYTFYNITTALNTLSGIFYGVYTSSHYRFGVYAYNTTLNVAAVKLELGPISTLVNDPPADYGEELLKCLRFYYRYNNTTGGWEYYISNMKARSTTQADGVMVLPVPMRVAPSLDYGGSSILSPYAGAASFAITSVIINSSNNNRFSPALIVTVASGLTTGSTYDFLSTNSSYNYIGFSADL
jgi:hypothetical protein